MKKAVFPNVLVQIPDLLQDKLKIGDKEFILATGHEAELYVPNIAKVISMPTRILPNFSDMYEYSGGIFPKEGDIVHIGKSFIYNEIASEISPFNYGYNLIDGNMIPIRYNKILCDENYQSFGDWVIIELEEEYLNKYETTDESRIGRVISCRSKVKYKRFGSVDISDGDRVLVTYNHIPITDRTVAVYRKNILGKWKS